MPIEMRIEVSETEFASLPPIQPGDMPASIVDGSAGRILIIGCEEDDSGGYVQELDANNTKVYEANGKRALETNDISKFIILEANDTYETLIGVEEKTPNKLGNLVIKHTITKKNNN